jgi:DNA-binding GntR family transcriptional regulator
MPSAEASSSTPSRVRRGPAAPPLSERAYTSLRDALITLAIAPGAAIDEHQAMLELDVGRTPVREAIKRLALEDLVVVYPRRGTFATEINITDLADITDVRAPLEAHASRRAADRVHPSDGAELERLLERLTGPPGGKNEDLMELDADVHRLVHRMARNGYLERTLSHYLNLSLRIWHVALHRLPALDQRVDDHRLLLESIHAGDADAAAQQAEAHVRGFEVEIRQALS